MLRRIGIRMRQHPSYRLGRESPSYTRAVLRGLQQVPYWRAASAGGINLHPTPSPPPPPLTSTSHRLPPPPPLVTTTTPHLHFSLLTTTPHLQLSPPPPPHPSPGLSSVGSLSTCRRRVSSPPSPPIIGTGRSTHPPRRSIAQVIRHHASRQ